MIVDPSQPGAKEFVFVTLWIFSVVAWYEVEALVWFVRMFAAIIWAVVHGMSQV